MPHSSQVMSVFSAAGFHEASFFDLSSSLAEALVEPLEEQRHPLEVAGADLVELLLHLGGERGVP